MIVHSYDPSNPADRAAMRRRLVELQYGRQLEQAKIGVQMALERHRRNQAAAKVRPERWAKFGAKYFNPASSRASVFRAIARVQAVQAEMEAAMPKPELVVASAQRVAA